MRAVVAMLVVLAACGGDGGKPYGASCTQNDQCESHSCGGPDIVGAKTCSCTSTSDCPMGEVCQLTIDSGRRCAPAPDASAGSN